MRKNFTVLLVLLVAVLVATPALAAVDFKWGGQFRIRALTEDNVGWGSDDIEDHSHMIDQRLRLYFTITASENLKAVVKWEMGDIRWGSPYTGSGRSSGGGVGADGVNVELKNAYVDFAIPCTPTRAILGIQTITLLDGWIFDDDVSAAVFVTKLDPFKITVGYAAGQNLSNNRITDYTAHERAPATTPWGDNLWSGYNDNVDDFILAIDYACGPWKANLTGLFQLANRVGTTVLPQVLNTPSGEWTPFWFDGAPWATYFGRDVYEIANNNFFDLGFQLQYKIDWLKLYLNAVFNFGSVKMAVDDYIAVIGGIDDFGDLYGRGLLTQAGLFQTRMGNWPPGAATRVFNGTTSRVTKDYTGWMIEAGGNYYCGPWTFNLGGFYTTGPDYTKYTLPIGTLRTTEVGPVFDQFVDAVTGAPLYVNWKALDVRGDVSWFTYPHAGPSKVAAGSEIIGGAIFDTAALPGSFGQDGTNFWKGYPIPTNLWTINAGLAYQLAPKTKVSFGYWYWGTSEKVMSGAEIATTLINGVPRNILVGQKFSSDLGHELNLILTQGIVDGLNLDLVGAYMFTGDAYVNSWNGRFVDAENYSKDDAWKLGARLQWNF